MCTCDQIGRNAHISRPTLSADRKTGHGSERVKKAITVGARAMVGFGSYLSAGATIGDNSMVGGYLGQAVVCCMV